jgi:hypothetical protein
MRPMMARLLLALGLLVAPAPGDAGPLVTREFPVSVERAWAATVAILTAQGWGVDDADRTVGAITTKSHRIDGEDGGMWSETTRLRLRLSVRPVTADRARVSVERDVFRRERIFWVERDERIRLVDPARPETELERALLLAIGQAL